jgi:hypothetical protein
MPSISWNLLIGNWDVLVLVKIWKTNLYDWFTCKGKIKAKYVHVIELDPWIETKKQNLPILENNPILRYSIVAMLQKMKEASQPLAISIIKPYFVKWLSHWPLMCFETTKLMGLKLFDNGLINSWKITCPKN